MGIPRFYKDWLRNQRNGTLTRKLPLNVSSLAFDLNGIFHDALNELTTDKSKAKTLTPDNVEEILQEEIGRIILRIVRGAPGVRGVHPQDCLIMAVDGVAPAAKMQQQKARRERSAMETVTSVFDRNAITPGTEFMIRLDAYLRKFIETNRDLLPPQVIYSSHLVPGEGEHKIMDFYRDGLLDKYKGIHVIWGLDADLIMLSLLAPLNNIFLSRGSLDDNINIDNLREMLVNKCGTETAIEDFVVIMCLLGNDFLPHSPSLEKLAESIEFLLGIYIKGKYQLTKDGEINWTDMKKFLNKVSESEITLLTNISRKEVMFPSSMIQEAAYGGGAFRYDKFRASWYSNALGYRASSLVKTQIVKIVNNYQPTVKEMQRNTVDTFTTISNLDDIQPENIAIMVEDYLRSISWVYLYYEQGTSAINQDWAYRYYHTPLLSDIVAVLNTFAEDQVINGFRSYPGMQTFTALHQLLTVLPLKSVTLLPEELKPLMATNSPIRDFYPAVFEIELEGKHSVHEGVPLVPLIDRQRIFQAVSTITFRADRASLWLPANSDLYLREDDETKRKAYRDLIRKELKEISLATPPKVISTETRIGNKFQQSLEIRRGSSGLSRPPPGRGLPRPQRSYERDDRGPVPFRGPTPPPPPIRVLPSFRATNPPPPISNVGNGGGIGIGRGLPPFRATNPPPPVSNVGSNVGRGLPPFRSTNLPPLPSLD